MNGEISGHIEAMPPDDQQRHCLVDGRLRMRLWHDANAATLSVTVVEAEGLALRGDAGTSDLPCALAKLRLLPNRV